MNRCGRAGLRCVKGAFATFAAGLLLAASTSRVPRVRPHLASKPPASEDIRCTYTDTGAQETLIFGPMTLATGAVANKGLMIRDGIIKDIDEVSVLAAKYPLANKISCKRVLITPGLVNAHEHLAYSFAPAPVELANIYVHRDEWRSGLKGKPKLLSAPDKRDAILAMVELRHLLHGETTVASNGGVPGLVKNVSGSHLGGKDHQADLQTFPFGFKVEESFGNASCDTDAARLGIPKLSDGVPLSAPYIPHVGEGTDCAAKLEIDDYLQYVRAHPGRVYSLIHGIAIDSKHLSIIKDNHVSVIWSPRSNLALYGKTPNAAWLIDNNVNVGIGSDWSLSGSYDMIEEMRCARTANSRGGGRKLTGLEILRMSTIGSARALGIDGQVGSLEVGKQADIAIFDDAQSIGTDGIGRQDDDAMVVVLVDGKLLAGDILKFQGQNQSACSNAVAGKFVCEDFSRYSFSFDQMISENEGFLVPLGTRGEVKCLTR